MPNSVTAKNIAFPVIDTPEPVWFSTAPNAGSWGSWLMQASHYGKVIEMAAKQYLDADKGDFFILLKGCINVYGVGSEGASKPVFVDALRSGDFICPLQHDQVKFVYETRSPTLLLKVPKAKYKAFMNDLKYSETVLLAAELHLMAKHSNAAQFHFSKDLDRIKRVISLLAQHPDSIPSPRGIEVKASKEEIRTLAGVERRSGSRAFKTMEEEGLLFFNGYKAFFFKAQHKDMA